MATIYAVVNQKGGVGKTTLAMNLAAGLARRNTCAVLDADPQCSATFWSGASGLFPVVVKTASGETQSELAQLAQQHHAVVVDCPPSADADCVVAVAEDADILLIPVLPSPMDLWASARIEELVGQVRRRNTRLKAYLVLNQLEPRNAMSRAMQIALKEFSVPSLENGLSRRAAYRTAALEGCSVYDLGLRGRVAASEVDAIIDEVQSL